MYFTHPSIHLLSIYLGRRLYCICHTVTVILICGRMTSFLWFDMKPIFLFFSVTLPILLNQRKHMTHALNMYSQFLALPPPIPRPHSQTATFRRLLTSYFGDISKFETSHCNRKRDFGSYFSGWLCHGFCLQWNIIKSLNWRSVGIF